MNQRSKSELKMSTLRQEISTLLAVEQRSDEQQTRLQSIQEKDYPAAEVEYRAAILVEPESKVETGAAIDSETTEKRSLLGKAHIGRFVAASLGGQTLDGAEAEVRSAFNCDRGIPFEMFSVDRPQERKVETRADVVSPAPSVVGLNIQSIQQDIFAPSLAPVLGISMPSVQSGTFAIPQITTSLTASSRGKDDAIESSAAALTVQSATPKRISTRLTLSIHDLASVGIPAFEAKLRENMRLGLSAEFDNQAVNGDGQNDKLNGLLKRLTDPTAAAAVTTYVTFHTDLAGQVDGLYAATLNDLSLVVNPSTYTKFASTFQANTAGNNPGTIADAATAKLAGFRSHHRMPAGTSNVHSAIVYKRGLSLDAATLPIWDSGLMIDDPYTGSATGLRHFTINILCGDLILLRAGAYSELSFKTA